MTMFPENKKFAFTILDDTDLSTVDNISSVYRLLTELGMRTTKTVWPLASVSEGRYGGSSLQDPEYLKFILNLKSLGYEIALHNVRNHDSTREIIEIATIARTSIGERLASTCCDHYTEQGQRCLGDVPSRDIILTAVFFGVISVRSGSTMFATSPFAKSISTE
jgi:hypothetical protein